MSTIQSSSPESRVSASPGNSGGDDGSQLDIARRAVMLGMASAVGYSAANLALRGLSGRHTDLAWSTWITAMKTLPTVILALGLMSRRYVRAQPLFPDMRPLKKIVPAALMMQFGGNLGFQVALGHIGLAITVPLVFAFIIAAGAVLGRIYLGDRVSPRTIFALVIMTVSVMLLSHAATLHESGAEAGGKVAEKAMWFGVLMAVVSGLSYGINGVVIRSVTRVLLPVESVLAVYSTTGLVTLGVAGGWMMGWERLTQIHGDEWLMMLCAGLFNAGAFFCVTHSLKLMNVSHVNVLNASQNAMCAIAAVLVFAEPVSPPMILGVLLSIIGLLALDRRNTATKK